MDIYWVHNKEMRQSERACGRLSARRFLAAWLVAWLCGIACLAVCVGHIQAAPLAAGDPHACCRSRRIDTTQAVLPLTLSSLPAPYECCAWVGLKAIERKPLHQPKAPALLSGLLPFIPAPTASPRNLPLIAIAKRPGPSRDCRRLYLTNRVLLI